MKNASIVNQVTVEDLARLFEEFAQRLRGMAPMQSNRQVKINASSRHISYTTQELSTVTGVPVRTIRRMAHLLDPMPVGGRVGYVYPISAPAALLDELRKRAGKPRGRKTIQ